MNPPCAYCGLADDRPRHLDASVCGPCYNVGLRGDSAGDDAVVVKLSSFVHLLRTAYPYHDWIGPLADRLEKHG